MCSVVFAKGQVTIPTGIRSLLKKIPVTSLKSLVARPKRAVSLDEMESAIGAVWTGVSNVV